MEMPLVAEGLRKVAMLARLIATGTLLEQGYLFWDEPETSESEADSGDCPLHHAAVSTRHSGVCRHSFAVSAA